MPQSKIFSTMCDFPFIIDAQSHASSTPVLKKEVNVHDLDGARDDGHLFCRRIFMVTLLRDDPSSKHEEQVYK